MKPRTIPHIPYQTVRKRALQTLSLLSAFAIVLIFTDCKKKTSVKIRDPETMSRPSNEGGSSGNTSGFVPKDAIIDGPKKELTNDAPRPNTYNTEEQTNTNIVNNQVETSDQEQYSKLAEMILKEGRKGYQDNVFNAFKKIFPNRCKKSASYTQCNRYLIYFARSVVNRESNIGYLRAYNGYFNDLNSTQQQQVLDFKKALLDARVVLEKDF